MNRALPTRDAPGATQVDRPTWSTGIDPVPVHYVNPLYGEDEDKRHQLRFVGHLTSAAVAELMAQRKAPALGGTFVPARDVMLALLTSPEGFYALWPPWPPNRPDHRRGYLRNLARYHDVTVKFYEIERGNLLVSIDKEGQPRRPAQVRTLSPIQAEGIIESKEASQQANLTHSFLRPPIEVEDDRDEYEPYSVYITRLHELQSQDPGAGVVYPYHALKDTRNQQIRLHQEAQRWGLAISIRSLDPDHAMLLVKRRTITARDGRRRYEKQAEEAPVQAIEKGKVLIRGTRLRAAKPDTAGAQPSMEDL